MSEHFLLSRVARDLPVTKVIRMSEDRGLQLVPARALA